MTWIKSLKQGINEAATEHYVTDEQTQEQMTNDQALNTCVIILNRYYQDVTVCLKDFILFPGSAQWKS